MVTTGLLIRIEAKPERVEDVEDRFASVVEIVRNEGLAVTWFALRLGPTSYAIFDVFKNVADRDAHLAANGPALEAAGAELFTDAPTIDAVGVVAAMLPGQ
jgi:quinol monooxygenase YgiN